MRGASEATNLHERLPVLNANDELGQLATIFNDLLNRLDQSFDRQRRFIADASHELRTPLAILRGEAEVAMSQQGRSAADYLESLGILHQETSRLIKIVEDLFTPDACRFGAVSTFARGCISRGSGGRLRAFGEVPRAREKYRVARGGFLRVSRPRRSCAFCGA